MGTFARLVADGDDMLAVDIIVEESPTIRFHPALAASFVEVPSAVRLGSRRDAAGVWTHPEFVPPLPVPAAPRLLQVSPPTFKLLFAPAERIAIRAARAYAGAEPEPRGLKDVLDDWFEIVDDPRLTVVDLALPATIAGVQFLVGAGILTQERADEILLGVPG